MTIPTNAQRLRDWTGPAVLGYGFRPFFLMAAIWAALAMALWVLMLAGRWPAPGGWDPIAWHAHALVFGYLGAVIAGFLLTAVPNWTGRLPVTGWPLAGLAGLWLAGRGAVAAAGLLPWPLVLALDLAFPLALCLFLGREVLAGRNWRNLPVLALATGFTLAVAGFHLAPGADGYGLRAGLAAVLLLIALIGGRIIPSFTRNWLAARGARHLPAAFGAVDKAALALAGVALAAFALSPDSGLTAALAGAAGIAQLVRMARWRGLAVRSQPLLWVLHLAYGFLGLGFLAVAAAGLDLLPAAAARHVWFTGTIGLMTLAVMSRASLGHTGRPLSAGPGLTGCYLALILSVPLRLAAGIWPEAGLLEAAAALWILAFAGFGLLFWPVLTRPRLAPKRPSHAGA